MPQRPGDKSDSRLNRAGLIGGIIGLALLLIVDALHYHVLTGDFTMFTITIGPILLFAVIFALIKFWTPFLYAMRWKFPPGHCTKCGYDLRASKSRCPECGQNFRS